MWENQAIFKPGLKHTDWIFADPQAFGYGPNNRRRISVAVKFKHNSKPESRKWSQDDGKHITS